MLSPAVSSAPSLLRSGYATVPILGCSRTSIRIAVDSTKPFDWTVLAEVALPPQAEPSLITDRDPPGQSDLRVCLIALAHRGQWGKNDHVEAHAW